ncbi:ATP-binding protein [Streptomyces fructofermentans]|uniref:Histidine kinase/HSP90-like ATPase domain-containing protein n=1 Tax=Streptomyces fructofermentans TaxID=152141 RepID=A0A918NCM5_9ACTN|nr:ATP-binding protein [Streptomyces fructofermentans]GGX62649.1 hypothetical protein GCM10010515_32890 [Streptomyces fructofermentans]
MKETYIRSVLPSDCGTSTVRSDLRRQLVAWGRSELADDAALVIGELLSNAMRHGKPPVRVVVACRRPPDEQSLRVEVTDSGHTFDVALVRARWRHPSFTADIGGRGLFLVDALCHGWGDQPAGEGHTVWADLS